MIFSSLSSLPSAPARSFVARLQGSLARGLSTPISPMAACLLACLVGALGFVPLQDYDLWWHLAIGREIAQGGWPWLDSFSWTQRGQPLSFVPWLPSLYFYGAFGLGGVAGLVFLQGLHCGLWAWLSLRYHRHVGSAALWTLLVLLIALPLIHSRLILLRSQFVPYLWLPWAAWLGWHLEKHPASRWKWAFVAWMALWVQSHASFALGLAWIGLVLVWPKLVWPEARRFWKEDALVLLACLGACFLTPSGVGIFAFLFQHAKSGDVAEVGISAIFRFTSETIPLSFGDLFREKFPYVGLVLLSLPGLLGLSWKRYGGEKLFWLLLLILPFRQNRFVGEVGLVACLLLPRWWTTLQAEASERPWAKFCLRCGYGLLVAFLLLTALWIGVQKITLSTYLPEYGFRTRAASYPTNCTAFLQEHRPQGKLYNSRESGGYLMWHLPASPVSVDGRTIILYSERVFYRVVGQFYFAMPSLPKALDAWGVSIALVRNDGFAAVLHDSKEWKAVCVDQIVTLFLRWGQGNDALLKKYGYYYLPKVHRNSNAALLREFQAIASQPDLLPIFVEELQRAIRESKYPNPRLLWLRQAAAEAQKQGRTAP